MKSLLSTLVEETSAFEVLVKELEMNVTSAENITVELRELLEQVRENFTQTQELLMSLEMTVRVELWTQLETAMRLNGRLGRRVS